MKNKFLLLAVSLLFLSTSGFAEDGGKKDELILSLKYKTRDKVTSTVEFYSCEKDPNIGRADCSQRLVIDGKEVSVPAEVLSRLNYLRRNFSYDYLSGTIDSQKMAGGCRMGGPSRGMILEARYLTYSNDGSFAIVSDEMKPVLSLASNCLFNEQVEPKKENAKADARVTLEMLNLLQMLDKDAKKKSEAPAKSETTPEEAKPATVSAS